MPTLADKTRSYLNSVTARLSIALCFILTLVAFVTNAQEKPPERSQLLRVDLLKLNGSKPNLTADGEGITAYKITDLFKVGVTSVKPVGSSFKIGLPTGYTLFNNLAYIVDSDAVFTGPNNIVFRIPSAASTETFTQLRILGADYDPAEPEKPRWVDITATPSLTRETLSRLLTRAELEALLPDFTTRTLHAITDDSVRVLVVALKDSKVARDNFTADLQIKVAVTPESVMEGREINYVFDITNNGPDTATETRFSTQIDPLFVSLEQSQGKCRFDAQNIYCNLGELKNAATATITYHGRCRWDFFYGGRPIQSNGLSIYSYVMAAENDSKIDNNEVHLSTEVKEDPNRGPVINIVKPQGETHLVGPEATLNLVANAYDPDGKIAEVRFFDQGEAIGLGKLTSTNTYELVYQVKTYGRHLLRAVATDDKGRPGLSQYADFLINGSIQIQITDPKPNFVKNPPHDEFVVKLRATNPKGKIKEIFVYISEGSGSYLKQAAQPVSQNEYSASFKSLTWECSMVAPCHVVAVAKDEQGIETTSNTVDFQVNMEPQVSLYSVRNNTAYEIKDGTEFDSGSVINLTVHAGDVIRGGIVKVDLFINGKLFKTIKNESNDSKSFTWRTFDIEWKPSPGAYILTATATDVYGAVGKSSPVRVVVK